MSGDIPETRLKSSFHALVPHTLVMPPTNQCVICDPCRIT